MNNYSIDMKMLFLSMLDDADVQEKLKKVQNLVQLEGYKVKFEYEQERANRLESDCNKLVEELKNVQAEFSSYKEAAQVRELKAQSDVRSSKNELEDVRFQMHSTNLEKEKLSKELKELQINMQAKESELNSLIQESEYTINELNSELSDTRSRIRSMEEQKTSYIEDTENKLSYVREFVELKKYRDAFSSETRSFIDELAGGSDIVMYACLGRTKNKLENLWTYIKNLAVRENTDSSEIEALSAFFDYAVMINSKIQSDKPFSVLDIEIGESFDSSKCIKTADSCLNGRITQVLVKGYEAGRDYCFKPVVRVE